jgi:hypothetical protein
MRSVLRFLSVPLMVFALGCGGSESTFEDRGTVPDGQSDPANAMAEMGAATGGAAPGGAAPGGAASGEAAPGGAAKTTP